MPIQISTEGFNQPAYISIAVPIHMSVNVIVSPKHTDIFTALYLIDL